MSYILDALKKSERARGTKTGRLLASPPQIPVTSSRPPRNARRLSYLVAIILFLNAGLFIFFLRPWQWSGTGNGPGDLSTDRQSPETSRQSPEISPPPLTQSNQTRNAAESRPMERANAAVDRPAAGGATLGSPPGGGAASQDSALAKSPRTEAEPIPSAATGPPPQQGGGAGSAQEGVTPGAALSAGGPTAPAGTPLTEAKTKETVKKPDTAKSQQTPKAPGIKKDLKTANSQAAEKNPASPVEQSSRTGGAAGVLSDMQALTEGVTSPGKPAAPQVQKWHELSPQVRDAIPDISLSMLIYSTKPGERWININGAKRREGDEISAGLKLDEITPDGAILNYRGRRFYKGVIGD